jgi:hypothetical protein
LKITKNIKERAIVLCGYSFLSHEISKNVEKDKEYIVENLRIDPGLKNFYFAIMFLQFVERMLGDRSEDEPASKYMMSKIKRIQKKYEGSGKKYSFGLVGVSILMNYKELWKGKRYQGLKSDDMNRLIDIVQEDFPKDEAKMLLNNSYELADMIYKELLK